MSNIYRIYPVLWNEGNCQQAQTVYAIDRSPPPNTFATICSVRPKEDPAYYWDNPIFQRLLPDPNAIGCKQSSYSVRWSSLPAWLSYITQFGYTVKGDFSNLQPFSDLYILGP